MTARCASATNPVAPGTASVIPPTKTQAPVPDETLAHGSRWAWWPFRRRRGYSRPRTARLRSPIPLRFPSDVLAEAKRRFEAYDQSVSWWAAELKRTA